MEGPRPAPRRQARPPPQLLVWLALLARRTLLALADRVVPAQVALATRIAGVGQTHALRAVARLRIADLLADGPLSSDELARRTSADPDTLHRILRALATEGFFRLQPDGRFTHTRLSRAFRSDVTGSMRDLAEYFGSASNVRAWMDLDEALPHGGRPFERAHGMAVWDWFDAHPEERRVFAGAMCALTELYGPAVARTAPFHGLRRVCDVGGGRGTLLAEVLRVHPGTTGMLIDGGGLLDEADRYLTAAGVRERVTLVGGSFFDGVPPGCDGYLLKNVLHDWDDAACGQILATCREAMAPGARVLLVESIVEADTTWDLGPLSDLQMLVSTPGGRERGRVAFQRLLERAGFRAGRIVASAGPMSVVEGVAV